MELWLHIGLRVTALVFLFADPQSGLDLSPEIIAMVICFGYVISFDMGGSKK